MIILSLEGLDKSGKASNSELLYQALYERGYNVEKSAFHRYDTPTGQLIRQFLDGEYQPGQYAIECIMAADKYAQLEWIKEITETTDVLILDRYLLSQCVYSQANGMDIDFIGNMLRYMPAPDYHFYLDITPEESMKRKGEHGDNDKYESNHALLAKARELYLKYFNLESDFEQEMIIDGTLPVDEIHKIMLQKTLSLLEREEAV